MLAPSDDDIQNFISSLGIKTIYDNLNEEDQTFFLEKMKELRVRKDFADLRFAELEDLSDMATVYKVKDFSTFNTLESKSFMKFIYYMLFHKRIIKLYPNEYDNLPSDIKTILQVDDTYHDRLKKSLIINTEK